jgi:hypothetical protein
LATDVLPLECLLKFHFLCFQFLRQQRQAQARVVVYPTTKGEREAEGIRGRGRERGL